LDAFTKSLLPDEAEHFDVAAPKLTALFKSTISPVPNVLVLLILGHYYINP